MSQPNSHSFDQKAKLIEMISNGLGPTLETVSAGMETLSREFHKFPDILQETAQRCHRHSQAAVVFLRRILDTIAFDPVSVEPKPQPLADILARVETTLRRDIERLRLTIANECPQDAIVLVDDVKFYSVLHSLIRDCVERAQPEGKIGLSLNHFAGRRLTDRGQELVQLVVTDTGRRLNADDLAALIAENALSKHTEVGMRLMTAKQVCLAHGGDLHVRSDGTTTSAIVTLPNSMASVAANASLRDLIDTSFHMTVSNAANRFNVLIAADNALDRVAYHKYLSSDRTNLIFATNGVEALIHLQRHSIDMIIAEASMPKMDGFELAEYANQMASYVPVFLVGASEQDSLLARAKNMRNVKGILRKPVTREEAFRVLGPHLKLQRD